MVRSYGWHVDFARQCDVFMIIKDLLSVIYSMHSRSCNESWKIPRASVCQLVFEWQFFLQLFVLRILNVDGYLGRSLCNVGNARVAWAAERICIRFAISAFLDWRWISCLMTQATLIWRRVIRRVSHLWHKLITLDHSDQTFGGWLSGLSAILV